MGLAHLPADAQALGQNPKDDRTPIETGAVAKFPAPGTATPSGIAFSVDGKSVTYLKPEGGSSSKVLWEVSVDGGEPRVIARAPGSGDTDANVSKEEALRRERQRLRDTGITSVVRASKADVSVIPLNGDLYLLDRAKGELVQITHTPEPEIDPQLSPDGKQVAYVLNNEVRVTTLDDPSHTTKLTEGSSPGVSNGLAEFMAQEEMGRFTGFWWAPDGSSIVYQRTDERHIPLFTITHQGNEYSAETHRYPFPGQANAHVTLLQATLVSYLPSQSLSLLKPEDDVYLARLTWENPSNVLVQVLSRDQRTLRLVRHDLKSNTSKPILEELADSWINLHNDLRLIAGTGEILWSSERSGYRHLELYDRDGKKIRDLTSGPWMVDAVEQVDQKRREVWFTGWVETPLEKHLYRVSLDGGSVSKVSQEAGTHRVVAASSGDFYVDTFASLTQPPITRLYSRDGKVLATLDDAAKNDSRVAQYNLTPPEIVSFKGRDGTEFHGAFYAPRSKALGARAPLVVMLYGGPHVQYVANNWTLTADMNAQHLAERGFAVWKMDNRGSSRRGVEFESAIRRQMGTVEVRDQADGVAYVANRWGDLVDTSKVGVTGSSYGGYMTLRCLTEAPKVFKAGVSVAPVTDWDGYDTCYTERYMGTPLNNAKGYRDSSVLPAVSRLEGELLLIHGMIDENVHFRHTARLISALIAANKPFQMLPLPEERHSSRREVGRKYVAERLTSFFEKSLR